MENIRYFERNSYDYVFMVKGNSLFIRKVIEEYLAELKDGYNIYCFNVYYNGIEAEKEKIIINQRFMNMDQKLFISFIALIIRNKSF